MIFWNALAAAALRARCACAMYKYRLLAAWGILSDGRTPRPLFASDSRHNSSLYGLYHTQPEPQHFGKKKRRQGGRSSRKERGNKIVARRERLGGNHAAQDERRRKDWAASFHHLSRKFYGHGHGGLPADRARRDRSARGRLHQHYAGIAAGNREKPGLSHGGIEQPAPGEIETAAAGRRGFRTRHGDAAG